MVSASGSSIVVGGGTMKVTFEKKDDGYEVTVTGLTDQQLNELLNLVQNIKPKIDIQSVPDKNYNLVGYREKLPGSGENKIKLMKMIRLLSPDMRLDEVRGVVYSLNTKGWQYNPAECLNKIPPFCWPIDGRFKELWTYLEWEGEIPPNPFYFCK
jgi:hypothetical protein